MDHWKEAPAEESFSVPDDVIDIAFRIHCDALPNDHAWALSQAVFKHLPWFGNSPLDGLHLIHVAESGHGWERPQGATDLLYPSRRTPLKLRLPKTRLAQAKALIGQTLSVDGNTITVAEPKIQLLSKTHTLYARHVISSEKEDETQFVARCADTLSHLNIAFSKIICGKGHTFSAPKGAVHCKSIMVGGLDYPGAIELQVQGLGPERSMGCGLFIPCKSI